MRLARQGDHAGLRALRKAGVAIDEPLPDGDTPLQALARAGEVEAVQCLLSHGATPDPFTLVMLADEDRLDRLLAANPTWVGERDGRGGTLLHWSAEAGTVEVAKALLAAGAKVAARDNRKETPLHRVLGYPPPEIQGPMAELLIEHGAPLDSVLAAALDFPAALEQLITARPARLRRKYRGMGLLHWALRTGSRWAAATLLELGIDPEAVDDEGRTAVEEAVRWGGGGDGSPARRPSS